MHSADFGSSEKTSASFIAHNAPVFLRGTKVCSGRACKKERMEEVKRKNASETCM